MPRLGVNIDHIATLREIRHGIDPEPVFAALICESAGVDSIVVHLREDRRHINEKDVQILRKMVKTRLNLEISAAEEIVDIACKIRPDRATLVPEKRQELTTEGGLDVAGSLKKIRQTSFRLKGEGIAVSLFIDPERKQVDAAAGAGVKMIEFHTGAYAQAVTSQEENRYFKQLETVSRYAKAKGLHVFAGHGLDYYNVARIAKLKQIEELNIGYSIICRAALVGLERAVLEMKALIN